MGDEKREVSRRACRNLQLTDSVGEARPVLHSMHRFHPPVLLPTESQSNASASPEGPHLSRRKALLHSVSTHPARKSKNRVDHGDREQSEERSTRTP
jgi:hypothetical protein